MSGATEEDVLSWSNRNPKHITVKTATSSCTLCSYETKFKDALKRHYTIVHPKEVLNTKPKVHTCLNCDNVFKSLEEFRTHKDRCNLVPENDIVKQLNQRICELEHIVKQLKEKNEINTKEEINSAKLFLIFIFYLKLC